MRKKSIFILVVVLALLAVVFAWNVNPDYVLSEDVSTIDLKPLDGIVFRIEATRKGGTIWIENNTDRYIVMDFSRKPVAFERLLDDSWHRIKTTKAFLTPTEAVSAHDSYAWAFTWRELLGGRLEPGTYRAVLFHGDGKAEEWDFFSTACQFQVD